MRIFGLLLLVVALLPATASAGPTLIGRPTPSSPTRYLDSDLRVIPGSPAIPRRYVVTLRSPGGGRFLAYGARDLSVYRTSTGQRLLHRKRADTDRPLAFVTRDRVLLRRSADPDGAARILSLNVRTGRVRRSSAVLRIAAFRVADGTVRALVRGKHGRLSYVELGPKGGVRKRFAVTLPEAMRADAAAGSIVLTLSGDRALASTVEQEALIRIGAHAAQTVPLDLPGGLYWRFLAPTVLARGPSDGVAGLASIDRDTGQVRRTLEVALGTALPQEGLTAYRGGVLVGLGRIRYDEDLDVVAGNPAAVTTYGVALRVGGRLYARLVDCAGGSRRAQVVDADTGQVLRTRGLAALGLLGGPFDRSGGDECD